MQNPRSASSAPPGDLELPEQALIKETDLQQCIESFQTIIRDLLIENESLRKSLAAATTSASTPKN